MLSLGVEVHKTRLSRKNLGRGAKSKPDLVGNDRNRFDGDQSPIFFLFSLNPLLSLRSEYT